MILCTNQNAMDAPTSNATENVGPGVIHTVHAANLMKVLMSLPVGKTILENIAKISNIVFSINQGNQKATGIRS